MTIEEKLERFRQSCMEDAQERTEKILREYKQGQEHAFRDHMEDVERRSAMQIEIQLEEARRDARRSVSRHQMEQKKRISDKKEELRGMLFAELRNELCAYMETAAYTTLLQKQIEEALEFSDGEKMTIYFDPVDSDRIASLSVHGNAELIPSKYSFCGGIRAVIPSKNILIDNSFETRLDEERGRYQFHMNDGHGGNQHG